VRVPEGYGNWTRESAWYRLRVEIPENSSSGKLVLEIGRIRFYGKAILNGQVVGESWQPRNPLVADVTRAAKPGETNELLVYTHCLAEGYSNPGSPLVDPGARGSLLDYYDTHDQAGIKGDVFLHACPGCAVTDIHIIPSVQNGDLTVHTTVRNDSEAVFDGSLTASVRLNGQDVLELPPRQMRLASGEETSVVQQTPWTDPVLWGPPPYGSRVLYHLESKLEENGDIQDKRYDRFGFRELWVDGDRFIFNGKPAFLMGTQISGLEMRQPMALLIPRLQEAGYLFVHPHAVHRLQGFYDLCDELGMLVWDCTYCAGPIGNDFKRWDRDQEGPLDRALDHHEEAYRKWVRQNRNHPCVAMWSAGCNNRHIHDPLRKLIESEDPSTRPVVTYSEPENEREVFMFGFSWKRQDDDSRDFSAGLDDIQRERDRRGDRTYPLFIGEYWGGTGTPECMDQTYDRGVAGGCTFEVGGYEGNLPPMSGDFEIDWPSESGVGQRRRNIVKLGHKVTHPGSPKHPNWCDPTKPVFVGEWKEQAAYADLAEKSGKRLEPANERAPEVIVTVTQNNQPVSHRHVIVHPLGDQSTSPQGVMTDLNGRAWFILPEPGRYQADCGSGSVAFVASTQPLGTTPGYAYIQHVDLPFS